jgi:hypothetical protein
MKVCCATAAEAVTRNKHPAPSDRTHAVILPAHREFADSPLEEEGFELLVPPSKRTAVRRARPSFFRARLHRVRSFNVQKSANAPSSSAVDARAMRYRSLGCTPCRGAAATLHTPSRLGEAVGGIGRDQPRCPVGNDRHADAYRSDGCFFSVNSHQLGRVGDGG